METGILSRKNKDFECFYKCSYYVLELPEQCAPGIFSIEIDDDRKYVHNTLPNIS